MKKRLLKVIAMGLCIATMLSVFAGCGKEETQGGDDAGSTGITKIVMTFPTPGTTPADLTLVQDRVNEISREKIGVEVEFKPVSLFDAASQIPMWIGGSERMDLIFSAYTGMGSYVTQNMVEPMDEYLKQYAPAITGLAEEGYAVYAPDSSGQVYGVNPMGYQVGLDGGYIISVEDLEAAGLSYENNQQITLDDLDLIFEKIKEAKPEVYPCGVFGNIQRANMTFISDPLGATTSSGVIMGLDSTEVVNYYETEEYYDYLKHARKWYKNGYIMQDAAATDYSTNELIANGTISGYFNSVDEALRMQLETTTGRSYINLKLLDPFTPAVGGTSFYWAIPVTAEEPEAAVKFLNLMYEEAEVMNTMLWGIEGVHWQFIDEEQGIIDYAEGLTQATSTYAYGYGFFGDQRMAYAMGSKVPDEIIKAKEEIAMSRKTKGFGFCYDPTNMTNQIITIDAIVQEYVSSLETGSADLETVYPAFIEKLKTNGIDDIIADKQAQFDAWLAEQ